MRSRPAGDVLERFRFLCSEAVAGVPHVIRAFVGLEEGKRRGDQRADLLERARAHATEKGLQFGEGLLDRIEVRAVGRQKPEPRAGLCDGVAHRRLFVHRQVVEHDHIARVQRRHQDLLHVGPEAVVIDGPIEHGGRRHRRGPERRDDRVRLPVPAGRVIADARPAPAARIAANQIGRNARFIHEDVLVREPDRLAVVPPAPRCRDIRTPLFVGVYRFF